MGTKKTKVCCYFGEVNYTLLAQLYHHPDRLILASEGGDMYVMCAVLDYVYHHPLETVATSTCFSAAVPIIAAGTRRYATLRCRFLVHPGQLESGSQKLRELKIEGKELAWLEEEYVSLLATRTKRDKRWWRKAIAEETYFDAKQALQIGLIDEVV